MWWAQVKIYFKDIFLKKNFSLAQELLFIGSNCLINGKKMSFLNEKINIFQFPKLPLRIKGSWNSLNIEKYLWIKLKNCNTIEDNLSKLRII